MVRPRLYISDELFFFYQTPIFLAIVCGLGLLGNCDIYAYLVTSIKWRIPHQYAPKGISNLNPTDYGLHIDKGFMYSLNKLVTNLFGHHKDNHLF